ncbi:hypothetical protein SCATT_08030 [Streptantibioticus cattleyicolor NRRL 8057 = DSM 46488]|uniref:Uncharacterized protein n=1 Tax=Streptantibioticus cattleyicolor (strain ATCC 35852 / DSM 46488 / JCM 4925 / NBRC 14057 / NRRL 8057) TaxID=1003195 RepID=G8WYY8_STREN|nr:hypothetical protein SCATT_08030 [Streptantibioticus cattleyicolor NRRL 8057 = DSM 46488]
MAGLEAFCGSLAAFAYPTRRRPGTTYLAVPDDRAPFRRRGAASDGGGWQPP